MVLLTATRVVTTPRETPMHSVQVHRPFSTLTRHRRHQLQHDIRLEIAIRRMDVIR